VLNYAGRYYEPATILRGVLPITEAHGLVWSQMRALNNLAVGTMNDDVREAERLIGQAVELARRTGSLGSATYFRGGAVPHLLALGRWDEVDRIIAELEGLDPADMNALDFHQGKALHHAFRGEDDQATAIMERMRPLLADTSLPHVDTWQKTIESQIAALAGRLMQAYQLAAEAMHATPAASTAEAAVWATRAALWMGDAQRARAAVDALLVATQPGRVMVTNRGQMRAGLDAMEGRRGEAVAGYREAIARWRDLDVPLYLGLCQTDFAILFGPDEPEATAAADEARALWTRLGSPPMLARLDEGLAAWPARDGDAVGERPAGTAGQPASAAQRTG